MKKLFVGLFLACLLVASSFAVDFTKSQGQILDWTLLDDTGSDNPFAESTIQTFADDVELTLNIVVAHADANDAAGNVVTVSVLVRAGSDNEAWRLVYENPAGGSQATAETLAANSGVSEANPERMEVADTTDFDTGASEWLFLRDTTTLVDSALVLVEGWADADYYINAWDLVRDYDSADILHNGVSHLNVPIPSGAQFFNVTFHNSDDDATYAVRVDYTTVTDIE